MAKSTLQLKTQLRLHPSNCLSYLAGTLDASSLASDGFPVGFVNVFTPCAVSSMGSQLSLTALHFGSISVSSYNCPGVYQFFLTEGQRFPLYGSRLHLSAVEKASTSDFLPNGSGRKLLLFKPEHMYCVLVVSPMGTTRWKGLRNGTWQVD